MSGYLAKGETAQAGALAYEGILAGFRNAKQDVMALNQIFTPEESKDLTLSLLEKHFPGFEKMELAITGVLTPFLPTDSTFMVYGLQKYIRNFVEVLYKGQMSQFTGEPFTGASAISTIHDEWVITNLEVFPQRTNDFNLFKTFHNLDENVRECIFLANSVFHEIWSSKVIDKMRKEFAIAIAKKHEELLVNTKEPNNDIANVEPMRLEQLAVIIQESNNKILEGLTELSNSIRGLNLR